MLFLLLILAHLLGDFIFQTNTIAERKAGVNRHMLVHATVHTGLAGVAAGVYFQYAEWSMSAWVSTVLIVGLTHIGIDALKVRLDAKLLPTRNQRSGWAQTRKYVYTFLGDQVLHLIVLIGITTVYPFHQATPSVLCRISLDVVQGTRISVQPLGHVLSILIAVILATRFSGILVGKLAWPTPQHGRLLVETKITTTSDGKTACADRKVEQVYAENVTPEPPRGVLIGYLERLIVMCLVFGQSYAAIGFIVAAKSLVRFKQLDHREWAEYFLVGTLASILLGMLWGHLLRALL